MELETWKQKRNKRNPEHKIEKVGHAIKQGVTDGKWSNEPRAMRRNELSLSQPPAGRIRSFNSGSTSPRYALPSTSRARTQRALDYTVFCPCACTRFLHTSRGLLWQAPLASSSGAGAECDEEKLRRCFVQEEQLVRFFTPVSEDRTRDGRLKHLWATWHGYPSHYSSRQ